MAGRERRVFWEEVKRTAENAKKDIEVQNKCCNSLWSYKTMLRECNGSVNE